MSRGLTGGSWMRPKVNVSYTATVLFCTPLILHHHYTSQRHRVTDMYANAFASTNIIFISKSWNLAAVSPYFHSIILGYCTG